MVWVYISSQKMKTGEMDGKGEAYTSKVARANSVQQNIVATISQTTNLRIGSTQSLGWSLGKS